MSKETNQYLEHRQSYLTQVRKFVTRVWEHPLVTESIREHRRNSIILIESALEIWGINKGDYIALPVGSALWAVNRDSDFDCVIFTKDEQTKIDVYMAKKDLWMYRNCNVIGVFKEDDIENPEHYIDSMLRCSAFGLLFVPDDYIAGSSDVLAPRMRIALLSYLRTNDPKGELWEKVKEHFNFYYRNWAENRPPYDRNQDGSLKNRQQRIGPLLEHRSRSLTKQERKEGARDKGEKEEKKNRAELWKEKFQDALNSFKIPDFNTYYQAMGERAGQVRIHERYKARGI